VNVLVHHLKKPAPGAKDRGVDDLRGGEWGQSADVVAIATPLGERRVKFTVHKRMPYSEIVLEQAPSGAFRAVAETGERARSNDERVIDAIDQGADSVEQVCLALGIAERTVWAAVKRLRAAGILKSRGPLQRPSEDVGE
jgi:hypothetical protein